ncbi:MAG TPA: EAL domain-containing protein, partial [Candidatus Caccomorpha excrementavium]|nr:EAL domain-containing protein [Candidatus Caccomorpha excrementavium]
DYLLPRIQGEWKRFSQDTKRALSANGLSSLQNLQSYMDMVYSLTSDMYSSMGVLAIDIPNLSTLHIRRGYEYGSRFILRISEILTDVFGKAFLFHTREAEFVVLCVNTTFTVFEERCTRVQMLLENGYSGQFRLGRTWSDGVFAAKNLVQEARSMMFCDNSRTASGNEQFGSGILERDLVSGGQFTVYLQPKIDMRTGAAVGAEALARVIGENGQVILPGSIIDKMEQDGTIHELDYFVLDRTLSLLSEWKSKGYDLIPVSTNFSRNTLMSPSALASALAILSRYPEIPPELIEFEITETAGNIEKSVLSGIIERFREFGLRFALDDFGSNYSNIAVFTNIKFDTIKLDRSLIKELTGNNVGKMLVRDIVQICKSCGMMCIAEGVENQNQVTALLREGCIYCQGYYYDRPMASGEFEQKYLRLQKIEQEEEI